MDDGRKLRPRPPSHAPPVKMRSRSPSHAPPAIRAMPRSRSSSNAPPVKKRRSLPPAAEAASCAPPPATALGHAPPQILKRVPSQKSDPVVSPYGPQILFFSQPRDASSQATNKEARQDRQRRPDKCTSPWQCRRRRPNKCPIVQPHATNKEADQDRHRRPDKRAIVQPQASTGDQQRMMRAKHAPSQPPWRSEQQLRVAMMRAKHAPTQPQAAAFVGRFNDVEDHRRAAAIKQRAAGDSHRLWLDKKYAKRKLKQYES